MPTFWPLSSEMKGTGLKRLSRRTPWHQDWLVKTERDRYSNVVKSQRLPCAMPRPHASELVANELGPEVSALSEHAWPTCAPSREGGREGSSGRIRKEER